jgi:hypothetical protein
MSTHPWMEYASTSARRLLAILPSRILILPDYKE